MRKQHGIIFQAPLCKGHNAEMSLSRFNCNNRVEWMWFCPHDDIEDNCDDEVAVTPPSTDEYSIPQAVLAAWGDEIPRSDCRAGISMECQCCCIKIEENEYCEACDHNLSLQVVRYESDNPESFDQARLHACPGGNCDWWTD